MVDAILSPIGKFFFPGNCYDEIVVKFNFENVSCLKSAVSRVLGLGIIIGSVLVKVPQLMKIYKAKSGEGISFGSVSMEVAAVTASLIYGYQNGFPFSAYGESLFIAIQTLAIGWLVLEYNDRRNEAIFYCSAYLGATSVCMSPVVSKEYLWVFQASVMPMVSLARMTQILTNFRNGHTGQLSLITCGLLFAGAIARIGTSIQETGDSLLVGTYILASLFNGIILGQIAFYWNATPPKKAGRAPSKHSSETATDDAASGMSSRKAAKVKKSK